LVFEPLSTLSYTVALRVWTALSALLLMLGVRRAAPAHWPLWIGCLAFLGATRVGFAEAQPGLPILGVLLYALGCLRDRNDRVGGAGLGIAAALKLYPTFLAVAFLGRHRSRQVLVWAGLIAAVIAVAGAIAFRLSAFHEAMTLMRGASRQGLDDPTPHNQSLPGVLLRASGYRSIALLAYVGGTVVAIVWLYRTSAGLATVLGAACCLMLITQTLSWEHYFVILVFPLMILAAQEPDRASSILGAISFAFLTRATPFPHLPTTGWPAVLNAPSLIGALLLLGALFRAARADLAIR
jgi:alpha-1,2-mannosyltransferase